MGECDRRKNFPSLILTEEESESESEEMTSTKKLKSSKYKGWEWGMMTRNKRCVSVGQTEERVRRKKEISFFTTLLLFPNCKSVLYILIYIV